MATFLELAESSGRAILINADQIVTVVPEVDEKCRIALANDDVVVVNISLDRLTELVNR